MITVLGTLIRSRPNPLRDTRAQKLDRLFPAVTPAEANASTNCRGCGHRWHGLTCRTETCSCPTAWVAPE